MAMASEWIASANGKYPKSPLPISGCHNSRNLSSVIFSKTKDDQIRYKSDKSYLYNSQLINCIDLTMRKAELFQVKGLLHGLILNMYQGRTDFSIEGDPLNQMAH